MPAVILVGKQGRVVKGGEGSGNFGHAGRPGEVGGSAATDLDAVAAAITARKQMPTQVLGGVIVGQQTRFAAKGKWAVVDHNGGFAGPFEATPERAVAAHRRLAEEAAQRARADDAYGEAADRVLAGTHTPADLRTIAGGGTKITRTGIERLLKRYGWKDKQIRSFVSRLGIYGETGGGATLYSPAEVVERVQGMNTQKGGGGSGYFHHAGIPGHRGGSAPDGIGTLTGGPAATAAPATAHAAVHAQGQAPTHGLTLPTVNLRNRPAVHKQLDSFMASSPALSKAASSRQPLPKAALAPIPEKHLGEVMRATGTDSKLPTKQNLAIGAKSLFMPVKGQDELDAYMEQRLKEKGPRSAAGSGGKGSFFKPSPAKGANAHAQLKKDAKVADGKKLEKTRKKTREETRGLLLSAVEEAARTGNWANANALQIKYELAGGLETFALLMGYQAVDGGTETGILVLDRSALVMNPTPIVGVTPTPPRGNSPTPLPHQVPGLGRGRVQTPLPRGGAITKGGTGSGNFQHQGIPGHRGGSAPNGGPQEDTDHTALVAALAGEAQAPGPEWKRALDQLNATGWAATPSPAPSPTGGTLWNPEAATVKRLEKKRKAFLKELDKTGPSLTDLQARYDELTRRSAFMNRKDPLTEAEKKEWRAIMDDKLIEKKRAADRALFLKHFGNKTPTRPPLPDVKLNDLAFQQNYQESQNFLARLLVDTPRDGDGIVIRPQVKVETGIRSCFKQSEDRIYLTDTPGNMAVHEYGHYLEKHGYTETGVDYSTLANDYLDRRAGKSKVVTLASLAQDRGYESHEYTRPDQFLDPYTGRVYNNGATEITSMGLGHLFNDPGGFARGDPDHFLFTLHLIQGGNE